MEWKVVTSWIGKLHSRIESLTRIERPSASLDHQVLAEEQGQVDAAAACVEQLDAMVVQMGPNRQTAEREMSRS